MTVTVSNACPIPTDLRWPHVAVREAAGQFGPQAYADWRATHWEAITEAIEQRLVLRQAGGVERPQHS